MNLKFGDIIFLNLLCLNVKIFLCTHEPGRQ